jgi:hypothetical protein
MTYDRRRVVSPSVIGQVVNIGKPLDEALAAGQKRHPFVYFDAVPPPGCVAAMHHTCCAAFPVEYDRPGVAWPDVWGARHAEWSRSGNRNKEAAGPCSEPAAYPGKGRRESGGTR